MTLDPHRLAEYAARRAAPGSAPATACHAPRVSMFFDTLGQVRACCVNHTYCLGHLASQTLDEIWSGPAVARLREALARFDFSQGCEFCYWQLAEGHPRPHALKYDEFVDETTGPLWPSNMEFNLSNACNLECEMCSGELSSAIRSRRERLPPLPKYYDDRFFASLRKFLPHLRATQFLGGEPFLVAEHFRVWDDLIADRLQPAVHITTNGTQRNARVEAVLEALPVWITISLDGVSAQTLESIRRGVRYDELMRNVDWFCDYGRAYGRNVAYNFSLMRSNWREFADFLRFADERQGIVNVCTVVQPSRFSLFTLARDELLPIVDNLEAQSPAVSAHLSINRSAWFDTIARLRSHAEATRPGHEQVTMLGFAEHFAAVGTTTSVARAAEEAVRDWECKTTVDGLVCDAADRVDRLWNSRDSFLGIDAARCEGRPADALLTYVRDLYGPMVRILRWEQTPGELRREVIFTNPQGVANRMRVLILPRIEADRLAGSYILASLEPADATAAPLP